MKFKLSVLKQDDAADWLVNDLESKLDDLWSGQNGWNILSYQIACCENGERDSDEEKTLLRTYVVAMPLKIMKTSWVSRCS